MMNKRQPFLNKVECKDQYSKLFSDLLIPAMAHTNAEIGKKKRKKAIYLQGRRLLSVRCRQ